jgi:hypothetical protein
MGDYDGGATTAPDWLPFVFPGLLFSPAEKHGKYTGTTNCRTGVAALILLAMNIYITILLAMLKIKSARFK